MVIVKLKRRGKSSAKRAAGSTPRGREEVVGPELPSGTWVTHPDDHADHLKRSDDELRRRHEYLKLRAEELRVKEKTRAEGLKRDERRPKEVNIYIAPDGSQKVVIEWALSAGRSTTDLCLGRLPGAPTNLENLDAVAKFVEQGMNAAQIAQRMGWTRDRAGKFCRRHFPKEPKLPQQLPPRNKENT